MQLANFIGRSKKLAAASLVPPELPAPSSSPAPALLGPPAPMFAPSDRPAPIFAPPIIPRPAPGIAYVEPRFSRSATFVGAALPVCGVDVLIVVVQPAILANTLESNLYVIAFQTRFHKTIVLMAQDDDSHVPTYFGPGPIVKALGALPFEIIPWQRMLYRLPRPPSWQLPIPPEPPPDVTGETPHFASSVERLSSEELSVEESLDDAAFEKRRTRIREADLRTTRR